MHCEAARGGCRGRLIEGTIDPDQDTAEQNATILICSDISGASACAVGNAVSFVLCFNFVSGFYVLAGLGLFLWRRWTALLPAIIAVATFVVFAALGWHVTIGGALKIRTAGAMMLGCLVRQRQ